MHPANLRAVRYVLTKGTFFTSVRQDKPGSFSLQTVIFMIIAKTVVMIEYLKVVQLQKGKYPLS